MLTNIPPIQLPSSRKPKRKVQFDDESVHRKRARLVPPEVHDKLNQLFDRAKQFDRSVRKLYSLAETKSTTPADIEREMFQLEAAIKRCQRASDAILHPPPPPPPPTPIESATPPGSPCAASPAGPRSFAEAIPIEIFDL